MGADAAKGVKKRRREKKQRKRIEDAVQYALAHKVRVAILILLNEASYTVAEIARLIEVEPKNVSNHIRRMLEDGSIEIAKMEERRGTTVFWYQLAPGIPYYSKEKAERAPEMERQVTAGLVCLSGTAELMAALFAGNLADPRTILFWDWFNYDQQGREDAEVANVEHLDRLREIECESMNRSAESGEETTPILLALYSFVRARKPRKRNCPKRIGRNQQTD
ncbi:MAG TPA: winged helix-turn-helix domain-containing protein [Solirubrobacterales bacterium]|nr:winged helix-turn-helix domain-containing protein [Solirubrobacterales bacterium]